ncbi:hypothetical protein FACS1894132_05000 [Clostridia bacterium]|nr:hypothetical protein FACS1894132_05000 [Clostridia bacterium]
MAYKENENLGIENNEVSSSDLTDTLGTDVPTANLADTLGNNEVPVINSAPTQNLTVTTGEFPVQTLNGDVSNLTVDGTYSADSVYAPENSSYNEFDTGATVVKKKGLKKVPLIIAAALAVVIAGSALSYAFVPSVKNFVRMNTMSPEKYFATVQKENFEKVAKTYGEQYGSLLDQISGTQNLKLSLSGEVPADAASVMGISDTFPDGIKASADIELVAEKQFASLILSAVLNETDFGTVNAVLNNDAIYGQYSRISDSWIGVKFDELTGGNTGSVLSSYLGLASYYFGDVENELGIDADNIKNSATADITEKLKDFDLAKYLSPSDVTDLLNRYNAIFVDGFSDVSLEKSKTVDVAGVKQKFAITSATMSSDELKDVLINALEELKNEKFVFEILKDLGIPELDQHTYKAAIELAIKYVDDEWDNLDLNFDITLDSYINSKGEIYGTEITLDGDIDGDNGSVTLSMLQALDGKKLGVEGSISAKSKDDFDGTYYPLTYKGTLDWTSDEKATGTIKVTINTDSDAEHSEQFTFPVKLKDFGYIEKRGQQYPVGTLSITVSDDITSIGDVELIVDYSYDGGPVVEATVNVDNKKYFSLKYGVKYDGAKKLDIPENFIDFANIGSYVDNINTDELTSLTDSLEDLFDSFGSSYDNEYDYGYDEYDYFGDDVTFEDGYNYGYDDGFFDGLYFEKNATYETSWGENEEFEDGYFKGYEAGFLDGVKEKENPNSDLDGFGVKDWGGYDKGAYDGKSAGEYDALYDYGYGQNFSDSNGIDPKYDEGFAYGYAEGFNKYSDAGGTGNTAGISNDQKPFVTNPLNNNNNGSVSTEPIVTTAPPTAIVNGRNYSNKELKLIVPNGYNVSEESGVVEVSNADNMLSVDSKYAVKYASASSIAKLYTSAGMKVTAQNENFTLGTRKGYRVDFETDGIKGVIVYITTGAYAPYAIIYNGNDTAVLEGILNSIVLS